MKNADMPAMPVTAEQDTTRTIGMTKREHFAAIAMQGLASNVRDMFEACPEKVVPADFIASQAVGLADALLAELERTS